VFQNQERVWICSQRWDQETRRISDEGQKFNRDDSDDAEDEEDIIILKHKSDPLNVINSPVPGNVALIET
jgi:hypothetical protein